MIKTSRPLAGLLRFLVLDKEVSFVFSEAVIVKENFQFAFLLSKIK